jgi:AbrB family looped-hinge helix DNA binding protein
MSVATLTSKGQTTIPKDVRERLGLKPGDKIRFMVDDNGRAFLIPLTVTVKQLRGMLPKPEHPATIEEMDEAIAQGIVERYLGSTPRS